MWFRRFCSWTVASLLLMFFLLSSSVESFSAISSTTSSPTGATTSPIPSDNNKINLSTPRPTKWFTKIVCTIGPSSSSEEKLTEMINAGMDVCRLNFSHGEHSTHQEVFDRIRKLSKQYKEQVAILCDIQGPKLRTGKMKSPFMIYQGDIIRVTPEPVIGTEQRIQISYDTMLKDLDKGDTIYINDGIIKLVVVDKDIPNNDLICECLAAGTISDHKGCNMPSGKLSVNVVTPKDADDLAFIAKLNPEYVAASFVGCADDVQKIRALLAECGNKDIKIIAKIERPVALENLGEIIAVSDAIMVARGDLGVEIDAWDVPYWQKEIVKRCNKESRPCIMATQMLESMISNSRPTRAEASDVYNAVIDGADAVMLSGESSVGDYPVQSVEVMDEIVRVAQEHMPERKLEEYDSTQRAKTETVCHGACTIAELGKERNIQGKIIVVDESTRTARLISKYRPPLAILAFSESIRTVRELALVWGVRAYFIPEIHDLPLEQRAIKAISVARNIGYLDEDDTHVCVLSASQYSGTGFYTGVYEIGKLDEMDLIG